MRFLVNFFIVVGVSLFASSESLAQFTSVASSSSSSTPKTPPKCDHPEVRAYAPLQDFEDLDEACQWALEQIKKKKLPNCAPGCVSVKIVDIIHGSQQGFLDAARGVMLDFIVGDECRRTRRRICIPAPEKK